jgi:plastocyanin
MRAIRSLVLVVLLAAAVAGCSSSKKSSSSVPPAGTAPNTVTIKNFSFSPTPLTVAAGATVSVINSDGTDHTVTSDDRTSFDTKHVSGGKSATFTAPSKSGTYKFHCNIHQYMTSSLVVQ